MDYPARPHNNGINTGLILESPNDKDHVVGGVNMVGLQIIKPPAPVVFPTGHGWHDIITKDEGEVQKFGNFDTFSCVTFATLKALVKYIKKMYGDDIDLDESFTAVMSGTIPGQGNSVRNVLESIRTKGAIDEIYRMKLWNNITQDLFFSAITAIQRAKGLEWLDKYNIYWDLIDGSDNVPHSKIIDSLKYNPVIVTGYAWASYYGNTGVFYDYNYQANHCFLIDDYRDSDATVDLLANDSYRADWAIDKPDHTDLQDFVKPLAKEYRIWSAHRIYCTPKDKKKIIISSIKYMKDYYYFWDKNGHNVYRIGVPSGETKKYRQKLEWSNLTIADRHFILMLRDSMNQSSWSEVSQYPDISTINKSFV